MNELLLTLGTLAVGIIILAEWLFPGSMSGNAPPPREKTEEEKHKDLYGY